MSFESLLTAGAIGQILDNHKPENPVLQIIGFKSMAPDQMAFGESSNELRYRLMIGDGVKAHQYCVITNQEIVEDIRAGRLEKWSIVKVTSYQTVDYPSETRKCLIYILNLEIVKNGSEVGHKLSVPESAINNRPAPVMQQDNSYNRSAPVMQQDNNYNRNNSNNFNNPYEDRTIRQQNNNYNADSTQPQAYPTGGMQQELIRSPRIVRNNNHDHQAIGIGELTPYIGRWVIKGRVTSKSGIREYNNAKGGGKLFSFSLADKSGEIKVTAFNADCERVFPYVEPNKVYYLGRASVKSADKRYTTADFEITLNNDSLLEEVMDENEVSEVPLAKFNFVSIGSLPVNQPVDLVGAITQVSDVSLIMSKTKNKELKKRNITIVDMSRHTISVTIWGDPADTFTGTVGDVFVTKAARIGTYGGKSASAGDCIFINPEIPETRKVKQWYSNLLDDTNFIHLTSSTDTGGGDQWRTLQQILNIEQAKIAVSSGVPSSLYSKCKATLISVGKNPVYKCCPTEGCGKKLVDTQNGELKCDKCQQTYSTYKYRYKTDIEIGDASSSCWTTLWDEKAEYVLGMKPDDLERCMRQENKEAYDKIITRPNFKSFIFTLRVRVDTYNNEERVKLTVVNMSSMDPVTYGKRLIDEIKAWGTSLTM